MKHFLAALAVCTTLVGCASMPDGLAPVKRAGNMELNHYMGAWFIIAAIPLPVEKEAFNPVESYVLNPDGTIATVFQFRKGNYNGELQVKPIVSEVVAGTADAEWRVQTIWPLKEQYVISYLESDYSAAIVGRDARDHVWILSRTPTVPAGKLESYKRMIAAEGYDVSKLVMFPQDGKRPLP